MNGPDVIDSFRGQWRFLSNFYPASMTMDGVEYPTSEHAYQASKTRKRKEKEWVAAAGTPREAKQRGQWVTLRPDWKRACVRVMAEVVREKFKQHPKLRRELLLNAWNAELIEGNHWGDTFWGVDTRTGRGMNYLGSILMSVRDEWKQELVVVVCGSRPPENVRMKRNRLQQWYREKYTEVLEAVEDFKRAYCCDVGQVITGKAMGFDHLGELWGMKVLGSRRVVEMPADWDKHGRAAGMIRNEQMGSVAEGVVALWDRESRGTRNMIEIANRERMPLHVRYVRV